MSYILHFNIIEFGNITYTYSNDFLTKSVFDLTASPSSHLPSILCTVSEVANLYLQCTFIAKKHHANVSKVNLIIKINQI